MCWRGPCAAVLYRVVWEGISAKVTLKCKPAQEVRISEESIQTSRTANAKARGHIWLVPKPGRNSKDSRVARGVSKGQRMGGNLFLET